MLYIIHNLIKETINDYINHKLNTTYELSPFIYELNHCLETTFYVTELDSLLSIHLFPYYLSNIKQMNIYELFQNLSVVEFNIMSINIINSDYFNDIDIDDPTNFFGYYYIYMLHEYRPEIQLKLLNSLTTHQFHF
jgi:hypothetical protein